MKLSELIEKLQTAERKHGNVDVEFNIAADPFSTMQIGDACASDLIKIESFDWKGSTILNLDLGFSKF